MGMSEEYKGAEIIGPFVKRDTYVLSYEGKLLPYVEAFKNEDGNFEICLDGRMIFEGFTEESLKIMTGVLANCMALAAGYPCHGADKKMNPHNVAISGITLKPNLTVIDGDKTDG